MMAEEPEGVAGPAKKPLKMHDRFFEDLETAMDRLEGFFKEAHEQLDTLLDFDVAVFDEKSVDDLEKKVKEFAEKHRGKEIRVGGFVLASVKKE